MSYAFAGHLSFKCQTSFFAVPLGSHFVKPADFGGSVVFIDRHYSVTENCFLVLVTLRLLLLMP